MVFFFSKRKRKSHFTESSIATKLGDVCMELFQILRENGSETL